MPAGTSRRMHRLSDKYPRVNALLHYLDGNYIYLHFT